MSNGGYGKNRQWWGVLYNENLRPDWQEVIAETVQLPYAYCVHDKGLQLEDGDQRKVHTHLILVWPSPTTYKHACEVFQQLSGEGKRCFSTIKPVYGARSAYDYLIHDTEDAKKKGKYQFDKSERITGNCYDIGNYEQVSKEEKDEAFDNMSDLILGAKITNFADFVTSVKEGFSEEWPLYRDVMRTYSGYFDRLIKGSYQKRTVRERLKEYVEGTTSAVEEEKYQRLERGSRE